MTLKVHLDFEFWRNGDSMTAVVCLNSVLKIPR